MREIEITAIIGSNEWFKKMGIQKGRNEEKEKVRKKIFNVLQSQGWSEEDILKQVELFLSD